jgi:alcohol oxidase
MLCLGGASACLIAGRLAAADTSIKILIVEAGGHTHGLPEHIRPAVYFNNLTTTSKKFSFHVANPSDHLGGRCLVVPSARCLGGGSSVNCKYSNFPYRF